MTGCDRYAPMLGAREGELAAAERAGLAEHLAGCAACQARLADVRSLDGLLGEALMRKAAARDFSDFADQVMERLPAGSFGTPPARPRGLRAALAFFRRHRVLAAGTALAPTLAALALIVYFERQRSVPAPMPGQVEVISETYAPMVVDTDDGPLIILGDDDEPEGT